MSFFTFIKNIFSKKTTHDKKTDIVLNNNTKITSTPNDRLGDYVQKFESGNEESTYVSWDSTGGTSYGIYQLASKTKVFKDFIQYINNSSSPNKEIVLKAMSKVSDWDVGKDYKNTIPYKVWQYLANENLIQEFEYGFIKQTRYDKTLHYFAQEIQCIINNDRGLQEMLWSTVVQHGPGNLNSSAGAYAIFIKCWNNTLFNDKDYLAKSKFVEDVYNERSKRFGSSTEKVRNAVLNRFKEENLIIQSLIGIPGLKD